MTTQTREIEGPEGSLTLRPARADDAAFQYALFAATRAPRLQQAGLPEPALDMLLRQQFRGRALSYRAQHPDAAWLIVERAGACLGELVLDDASGAAHIVDIALLPAAQGRGIGPALLGAVMQDYAGRGGVRAMADIGNAPSRGMFARLGFVEQLSDDGANVALSWPG